MAGKPCDPNRSGQERGRSSPFQDRFVGFLQQKNKLETRNTKVGFSSHYPLVKCPTFRQQSSTSGGDFGSAEPKFVPTDVRERVSSKPVLSET